MRERIRQQALNLYSQAGVEAISIRAVAHRVGVSPAGIYSFFKNRQALVEALWLDPVLVILAEMVRVAQATPDPLDRIARLLDIYIDFAFSSPEIYRGAFLHVRPAKAAPPNQRGLEALDFQRLLGEAIAQGQDLSLIRPGDPAILAQALWAGVHGALALPIHMEAWIFADRPQLVAQVRAMLVAGMRLRTTEITGR
jgi:AcrR family transcriptional regulator